MRTLSTRGVRWLRRGLWEESGVLADTVSTSVLTLDLRAALADVGGCYLAAPGGGPLTGREVATPSDPALAAAMRERGHAVHEEQVVDVLLADWSAT